MAQYADIQLTESFAMTDGGGERLVFQPPEARYFGVGRLGRDQVADYARRKGWTLTEAESGWHRTQGTNRIANEVSTMIENGSIFHFGWGAPP